MYKGGEVWKAIPGYEEEYSASSYGRIRKEKEHLGMYSGMLMKSSFDGGGYLKVTLRKNGEKRTFTVHKLISSTFFGVNPDGMCVNHKDGVKINNNILNLEYVTYSENTIHAFANGLMNKAIGERISNSKITESDVHIIDALLDEGKSQTFIAKIYNIDQSAISNIKRRRNWSHVKKM